MRSVLASGYRAAPIGLLGGAVIALLGLVLSLAPLISGIGVGLFMVSFALISRGPFDPPVDDAPDPGVPWVFTDRPTERANA